MKPFYAPKQIWACGNCGLPYDKRDEAADCCWEEEAEE